MTHRAGYPAARAKAASERLHKVARMIVQVASPLLLPVWSLATLGDADGQMPALALRRVLSLLLLVLSSAALNAMRRTLLCCKVSGRFSEAELSSHIRDILRVIDFVPFECHDSRGLLRRREHRRISRPSIYVM